MSPLISTLAIFVAAALGVLLWSSGKKRPHKDRVATLVPELNITCKHLAHFPQIRQALDAADIRFLKERSGGEAASKLRAERRRVALGYLEGLRYDFDQLMSSATIIAAFSPEIDARQESRRFRLNVEFRLRYAMARIKFTVLSPTSSPIGDLAAVVSSLAIDLDRLVNEIAATAALAQPRGTSTQG